MKILRIFKIIAPSFWFFIVFYFYVKSTNLSGFYYLSNLFKIYTSKFFSHFWFSLPVLITLIGLFFWLKKKLIFLFAIFFIYLLRHFIVEISLVVWLNLTALGLGLKIIKKSSIIAWGLGMIMIAYLMFFLGISKLLYRQIFYPILIISFLFSAKEVYKIILSSWQKSKNYWHEFFIKTYSPKDIFLILLISFYLILSFFQALAPETKFDALQVHLYLPKLYLARHQIYHEENIFFSSGMPQTMEMIFLAGLLLKNEVAAKLLTFSFGLFLIGLIRNFCKKFFAQQNISFLALSIFITIPLISWLMATAYVDIPQAFYANLSLFSFLNWHKTKKRFFLWLSALFLGAASSIKYTTVYFLIPFFLLFIYFSLIQKEDLKEKFKNLMLFFGLFLLPLIPWFVKNYLTIGNPFFPFLNHLFNPQNNELNNWIDNFIHHVRFEQLGLPRTIKNLILLPWNITIVDKFEENIGPLLLCFIPLILLIKKVKTVIKIFILFFLISLYSWIWGTQTTRYLTPVLPIASIIAAYALIKMKSVIYYLPLILISVPPFTHRLSYKIFPPPTEYILKGQKYKDQYLKDNLYSYAMYQYINKNLKGEGGKILSFFDANFYYIDIPIVYSFHYGGEFFYHYEKDAKELIKQLLKRKYTHIMINRNINYHAKLFLTDDFVKNYLELVHQENNVYLFKINPYKEKQIENIYFDFVDHDLSQPNLCPITNEIKRSLILKGNNRKTFRVKIKPNSTLVFFTGICYQGFGISDGMLVKIFFDNKKIFSQFLNPKDYWHKNKIDLSNFVNDDIAIEFISECQECSGDWAGFGEPLLMQYLK